MVLAKHYIDGVWTEGLAEKKRIPCMNPATSEIVAETCDGSLADMEAAIAGAKQAFYQSAWRRSPRLRAEVMLAFADRLEQRMPEIADWMVTLNGKIRKEAEGEIMAGVSELRYYAGLARLIYSRSIETAPGAISELWKEPAGVSAIILPWNAPVTLLIRSLAPALAAGCTAVIKPAPQTAYAHNLAMECLTQDERLPKGVVQTVTESGAALSILLSESPDIDVLSFTGSTAVGKKIAAASATTLKRLSLELGGKAPALVLSDADIDRSIEGIVAGGMVMAGQQCTAISRVIVDQSIYDAFADKLVNYLKAWRVGPGTDPQSQMGCLINIENRDRIVNLVKQAPPEAECLLAGQVPEHLSKGAFVTPSVLAIQDLNSSYIQQELFGPLLVLEKSQGLEDAIERANATRYSLASSVWTQDHKLARQAARELRFGNVWLNTHNRLFAEAETGGHADSGYGRLHGVEGLEEFFETKHFFYEM
ncbi:MAG: aldehyde dehydrogenase family protein [Pigmentiphaga sp.]|nr:aldehyde dehydrogenase family protein [Pigmentiphaga sp.]